MGVLKILVLCLLFFVDVAVCEGTIKPQDESTTVVNNRCKRETEIDVHARELKAKVPYGRKDTKPLIPVIKSFNPINFYPRNALPRRKIVAIKPKVVNTTENSVNNADVLNSSNSNSDSGFDKIKPSEYIEAVNLTTMNSNNNNKRENEKLVDFAQEKSELTTTNKDEDDKTEQTDGKQAEVLPEIVSESDIKNKNGEKIKNKLADTEIDQDTNKIVKTSALNPVEQLSPIHFLNNFKVVPGISIQKRRKPGRLENKPKSIEKEGHENPNLPKIYTPTEPLNNVNNNTEIKEVILTDAGEIPIKVVPRINLLQEPFTPTPLMKATNVSVALIPQIKSENKIKMTTVKPEPDVSAQSPKTGPGEIVIQNNNYDELYEASTQQYITPKLIVSDLRFGSNWNKLNSPSYENFKPQNYYQPFINENKPYSYEVKEYPNQYVVNAYDDTENSRQYNKIDDSLDSNMNNQDIKVKSTYTKNVSPWIQRYDIYNQPQTQDFIETSNIENYNQRPKRIWRSWKNNQVLIRPKGALLIQNYTKV